MRMVLAQAQLRFYGPSPGSTSTGGAPGRWRRGGSGTCLIIRAGAGPGTSAPRSALRPSGV